MVLKSIDTNTKYMTYILVERGREEKIQNIL